MRRAGILFMAALAFGCAKVPEHPLVPPLRYGEDDTPRSPTEDAPFRLTAPQVDLDAPVPEVHVETFSMDNGLKGYVVSRRHFPVIAVNLSIDVAPIEAGDVGGRRAGLMSSVFLSPPEGLTWTAAGCGSASCSIATRGFAGELRGTLERVFDVLTREERDALYAQRLDTRLRFENRAGGDPGVLLRRISSALLFGHEHRYGQAPPAQAPTLQDLRRMRRQALDPRRATLVVVGDVSLQEVAEEAARTLGAWRGPEHSATGATSELPSPSGPRITIMPNASMSQVVGCIVARGPAPSAGDYFAFRVLAQLLGGSPSSGAFQHVREEMTAAYSVGAAVTAYPETSVMSLGGSFERQKAIDGMVRLLDSIRSARTQDPNPEDLERAKRALLAQWRRALATDDGVASTLASALVEGVALEDVLSTPARIKAVQAAGVRDAAQRYLAAGALRIVLVGDPEFLVQAQELRYGVPTRVDGYGRPY